MNSVSQTRAGLVHGSQHPRGGGLHWQLPQNTWVHAPFGSSSAQREVSFVRLAMADGAPRPHQCMYLFNRNSYLAEMEGKDIPGRGSKGWGQGRRGVDESLDRIPGAA